VEQYILKLDELGMGDVERVGGKNASLGEMIRHLRERDVRVPGGFATTADAYRSRFEAARPRKIFPRRALPANKRPT
jgi:pyruvate,water dikinase